MSFGIIRFQLDRFAVVFDGLLSSAVMLQGVGEAVMPTGIFRIDRQI